MRPSEPPRAGRGKCVRIHADELRQCFLCRHAIREETRREKAVRRCDTFAACRFSRPCCNFRHVVRVRRPRRGGAQRRQEDPSKLRCTRVFLVDKVRSKKFPQRHMARAWFFSKIGASGARFCGPFSAAGFRTRSQSCFPFVAADGRPFSGRRQGSGKWAHGRIFRTRKSAKRRRRRFPRDLLRSLRHGHARANGECTSANIPATHEAPGPLDLPAE